MLGRMTVGPWEACSCRIETMWVRQHDFCKSSMHPVSAWCAMGVEVILSYCPTRNQREEVV